MDLEFVIQLLGVGVLVAPALLFAIVSVCSLLELSLSERRIAFFCETAVGWGLFSSIGMLVLMLATGYRHVPIGFGSWVVLPSQHFHFDFTFVFDRLSIPFLILTFVLVGTTGAFANRYLHREPGYRRFFVIYAMFLLGMVIATLAGTIETLFVGWELVGLSSALLVAYFQERQAPVKNGYRIWSIYRFSDAAFLAAAVTLHHVHGEGDFSRVMGEEPWPYGVAALTSWEALVVGLLLLVAAAGKSALVPFSGWLPRAMEGPTPSSAIFYGALSVHLGTYLLLRVSPLLELSPLLAWIVVGLGLVTALFSTMASSVQSDVKTALAYSSLTQVGIITAEIGMGFDYLPLVHMIGHACLRSLQLLRAPSLLQDYNWMENALGDKLDVDQNKRWQWVPARLRLRLYRFSFERGHFDRLIDQWIVNPFLAVFRWSDQLERRWTDFLSGTSSRESDKIPAVTTEGEVK